MKDALDNWFSYEDFSVCFEDIIDHRDTYKIKHDIKEIMLLALCAIICGAESWLDMENFGKGKIRFLRSILPYKNGIPSQYTIQRVFCSIDYKHFAECLDLWLYEIRERCIDPSFVEDLQWNCEKLGIVNKQYKQICIDGKTIRGAASRSNESFHIVSGWCAELGILIAQQEVPKKSNEISAITQIIGNLTLDEDTIISIDAIGCQREIAEKIKDYGGNYIFALKKNQESLYNEVEQFFAYYQSIGFKDKNHTFSQYDFPIELNSGRIENRKVVVINTANWLINDYKWKGIKSVTVVYSTTINKKTGRKSNETRFYISSIRSSAKLMGNYIRKHWTIESGLHWVLDTIFREDHIKIYERNAARNLATIRRLAATLLKNIKKPKQSIKSLKLKATFDNRTPKKGADALSRG